MWVGPEHRKKRLNFGEGPEHTLDTKKYIFIIFNSPISNVYLGDITIQRNRVGLA